MQRTVESASVLFQREAERGADARLAAHRYGMPVRFYDVLHDSQAQACSSDMPAAAAVGAVEAFKDPWEVLLGNARSVVGYFDINAIIVHGIAARGDGSAAMAVF